MDEQNNESGFSQGTQTLADDAKVSSDMTQVGWREKAAAYEARIGRVLETVGITPQTVHDVIAEKMEAAAVAYASCTLNRDKDFWHRQTLAWAAALKAVL